MPQDIPATCIVFDKKLLIDHALSCPKGVLVLAQNEEDEKEWGAPGDQALKPSDISCKPKTNSRTIQG